MARPGYAAGAFRFYSDDRSIVPIDGRTAERLDPQEAEFLTCLLERAKDDPKAVVAIVDLQRRCFGGSIAGGQVPPIVSRVRRKLRNAYPFTTLIETITRSGYRWLGDRPVDLLPSAAARLPTEDSASVEVTPVAPESARPPITPASDDSQLTLADLGTLSCYGRDRELNWIANNLQHPSSQVFICGESGVGKTALMAEFVRRHRERFKYVLWFAMPRGFPEALQNQASMLMTRTAQPFDTAHAKVREYLQDERALVVLDDVANVDAMQTPIGNLRQLPGRLLCTTMEPPDDCRPLHLACLDRSQVKVALAGSGLSDAINDAVADRVLQLTGGSPIFIQFVLRTHRPGHDEEFLRALREMKALGATLDPENLREWWDRLSPAVRRVLVIGARVPYAVRRGTIATLAGLSDGTEGNGGVGADSNGSFPSPPMNEDIKTVLEQARPLIEFVVGTDKVRTREIARELVDGWTNKENRARERLRASRRVIDGYFGIRSLGVRLQHGVNWDIIYDLDVASLLIDDDIAGAKLLKACKEELRAYLLRDALRIDHAPSSLRSELMLRRLAGVATASSMADDGEEPSQDLETQRQAIEHAIAASARVHLREIADRPLAVLWRARRQLFGWRATLAGADDHVNAVLALAPDGVAATTENGDVLFWSSSSCSNRDPLSPGSHDAAGWGIVQGTSDEEIITCSDDHTIRRWKTTTPGSVVIGKHDDWVNGICRVERAGRPLMVLSGGDDCAVKLWDVTRDRPKELWSATAKEHGFVLGLAEDDDLVASGHQDGTICLWSLDDGRRDRPILTLSDTEAAAVTGNWVRALAFYRHSGRRYLAAGFLDGTIRRFDLADNDREVVIGRHDALTRQLIPLPSREDPTHILSASDDATIRLWQLGEPLGEVGLIPAHHASIRALGLVPTTQEQPPADRIGFISGGSDGLVKRWEYSLAELTTSYREGPSEVLALGIIASRVGSLFRDGTLIWRSLDHGERVGDPIDLRALLEISTPIDRAWFAENEERLLVVTGRQLWEYAHLVGPRLLAHDINSIPLAARYTEGQWLILAKDSIGDLPDQLRRIGPDQGGDALTCAVIAADATVTSSDRYGNIAAWRSPYHRRDALGRVSVPRAMARAGHEVLIACGDRLQLHSAEKDLPLKAATLLDGPITALASRADPTHFAIGDAYGSVYLIDARVPTQ